MATPTQIRAVVRAYIDDLNRALATGQLAPAIHATDKTCPCRKSIRRIGTLYAKGLHLVGSKIIIESIEPQKITTSSASATLTYRVPSSSVVNARGEAKKVVAARGPLRVTMKLRQHNGRWLIKDSSALVG